MSEGQWEESEYWQESLYADGGARRDGKRPAEARVDGERLNFSGTFSRPDGPRDML